MFIKQCEHVDGTVVILLRLGLQRLVKASKDFLRTNFVYPLTNNQERDRNKANAFEYNKSSQMNDLRTSSLVLVRSRISTSLVYNIRDLSR